MYPVSNAFMEMINSNARKYYWTGSILTKTKKEYDRLLRNTIVSENQDKFKEE